MASTIYAASSIHSKSTLSRKYDVDPSAMFNMGNMFKVNMEDQPSKSTMNMVIQMFTLDMGRMETKQTWVNTIRLFIFPFYLILSSSGITLIENPHGFMKTIKEIIGYVTVFIMDTTSTASMAFNICYLVISLILVYFFVHILYLYHSGSCPSTLKLRVWFFISRIIMPIFTTFVSYNLAVNFSLIINGSSSSLIIRLVIAVTNVLIQVAYLFLSCSIYNATPIIKEHDYSQLWFSLSSLDWVFNLIILYAQALQSILTLFNSFIPSLLFGISITIPSLIGFVWIFIRLPYIRPVANVVILTTCAACPLFSFIPLICFFAPNEASFYFIGCVVILVILFFVHKFSVSKRVESVIFAFTQLREREEEENEDKLDPLSAAILQVNAVRNVDFQNLHISGETQLSFYLRIGFLYNVPEVTNQSFIKWATEQNIKPDLVLSACQVSYALQNDLRMMNNLEQLAIKITTGPFNTQSFAVLFNHLRQEILTQLNQPLLKAIAETKKCNLNLQVEIAEFWSAVEKQKLPLMKTIVAQVYNDMYKTYTMLERLIRNYPTAPTVLREAVLIYHKSLGEHRKTLECQNAYNKAKKITSNSDENEDDYSTTGGNNDYSNVDQNFREQMEPWVTAQDVIDNIKIRAKYCLTAFIIILFIISLGVPSAMCGISLSRIVEYQKVIEPIQIIGNVSRSVTRIPQLARRATLIDKGEVSEIPYYVANKDEYYLEFENFSETIKSLSNYVTMLESNSENFLDLCSDGMILHTTCTENKFNMTMDTVTESTIYDILSTYLLSARTLSMVEDYDWKSTKDDSDVKFLFNNFDTLFLGILGFIDTVDLEVQGDAKQLNTVVIVFYVLCFIIPLCIFLPGLGITMIIINKEMTFNLKVFFNIPKSETSAMKWNLKTKKQAEVKHVPQSGTSASQDSSIESQQLRREELVENLATVQKLRTTTFSTFIAASSALIVAGCLFCVFGSFMFQSSISEIVDLTNSYVFSTVLVNNMRSIYVWMQELFSKDPMIPTADIRPLAKRLSDQMGRLYDSFLYGSGKTTYTPGILVNNDIMNHFLLSEEKEIGDLVQYSDFGLIHEAYGSMSVDTLVHFIVDLSRMVVDEVDPFDTNFGEGFAFHYEHILFVHIEPMLQEACDMIQENLIETTSSKSDTLIVILVVLILIEVILFFVFVLTEYRHLIKFLETPLRLMLLVSPDALLKDQTIVKWMSGTLARTTNTTNDVHHKISHKTTEFACELAGVAGAITDQNLRISKFTNSFLKILGVEADQVAGMSLRGVLARSLIDKEKSSYLQKLDKEAKRMTSGIAKTSKFSFESQLVFNSQPIYINISLYGNTGTDFSVESGHFFPPMTSFVVIIRDITEWKAAEQAMVAEATRASKLLVALMPAPITKMRINGEQDFSFEAKNATLLYAGVVEKEGQPISFQSLTALFRAFDAELTSQTDICPVQAVGTTYMAVGGMFTDEKGTASLVADVAIRLMNIATQFGVSVSIGIDSGVVWAGIFGQIMPAFDVIGQTCDRVRTVRDAAAPGQICISNTTYDQIKYLRFAIKEKAKSEFMGQPFRVYSITSKPQTKSSSTGTLSSAKPSIENLI